MEPPRYQHTYITNVTTDKTHDVLRITFYQSTITIICTNILIYWFYWFKPYWFCNFSK